MMMIYILSKICGRRRCIIEVLCNSHLCSLYNIICVKIRNLLVPQSLESSFLSEWPLVLFAARTRVELGTWIILTSWFPLFKSFWLKIYAIRRMHFQVFSLIFA